ncbi:MAG: hypothetical protein E7409_04990 [Ruminococcaceae bacterium]|nr:hypothetical protein [Oscillospiraceae bacterium]
MKKQWSSFVSVLLAMTMLILVMVPFTMVEAAKNATQSENRTRLLSALGIDIDTQKDTVTRADFANYIYKTVRLSDVAFNGDMPFQDVKEEDGYYTAIGVLYQLGVLSKSERFNPGNIITAPEMAKMMVSALGYDFVAKEMGGYPYGYILCAQSLGISLNDSTAFTGAMIPDILFEMLEAHPNRPFTANQINVSDTSDGFLVYHNVRPIKGVMVANAVSTIYEESRPVGEGYINLDGFTYAVSSGLTDGVHSISDYLGSNIQAYVYDYMGENEKIIYFDTANNIFAQLNTVNVDKDGFVIKNNLDGKEEKYYLSVDYSVIWNGKNRADYTDVDFETIDGTILLIDHNRDGNYDVVNIQKPEYLIAPSVKAASGMISDKNKHGYGASDSMSIRLDDATCIYEYFIHDGKELKGCSLEDLESFESFSVIMSRDEQYIRITGFSNVVSGDITEYTDGANGSITIGEVVYDKTEYSIEHNKYVQLNTYTVAYLTPENKLIYFETDENNMRYGFLMKIDQHGSFGTYAAALLMETGNKEYVYFNDNITLDGNRVSVDFNSRTSEVYTKLYDKPQLIKYSLDTEGKIACVDTAENKDNMEEVYTDGGDKDPKNSLVCYTDMTTVEKGQLSYTTVFFPSIVPRNVKIFSVPANVNAVNYEFDAEDFELISTREIPSSGEHPVAVYDMARNNDAGAIVYYNPNAGGSSLPTLDKLSSVAVIARIANSINEDGVPVTKVTYVTFSGLGVVPAFQTGLFSEELQERYEEKGYEIGVGDMVLISSSGTTITNIEPHISYRNWAGVTSQEWDEISEGIGLSPAEVSATYFYAKGTLMNYSDSVLSILVDDSNPNDSTDNSGVMAFPIMNVNTLVRYNEYSKTFEKITLADLKTAYNSGMENADRIVLRTYNNDIRAIAIFPAASN